MIHRYLLLALLLLVSSWSKPLSAALITTDIIHVADDIWEYHYTIENVKDFRIVYFSLYF